MSDLLDARQVGPIICSCPLPFQPVSATVPGRANRLNAEDAEEAEHTELPLLAVPASSSGRVATALKQNMQTRQKMQNDVNTNDRRKRL